MHVQSTYSEKGFYQIRSLNSQFFNGKFPKLLIRKKNGRMFDWNHGLRTPREEIVFTARPKIHSHIFRYSRSIFCLPHQPKLSDFFDLCHHWVSVVCGFPPWLVCPYEKKEMENSVPPWLVSPSEEVIKSNVPGLYLRKYGIVKICLSEHSWF